MKQTLHDFELTYNHAPIKCDNITIISIFKNLVQRSKNKHIKVAFVFLAFC